MSAISKVEMAKRIIEGNPNASRKEIIEMFIDRLGMSKAGATTYAYNLTKGSTKAPKANKVAAEAPVAVKDSSKEKRLEMMKKVLAKMKAE